MITFFKNKTIPRTSRLIPQLKISGNTISINKVGIDLLKQDVNVGEDLLGNLYICNGKGDGEYYFDNQKNKSIYRLTNKKLAENIRKSLKVSDDTFLIDINRKLVKEEQGFTLFKLTKTI